MARFQSMRTALGERPMPRGDLVDRDVLQVTQDEDLAIVGGQFLQGVGQQHGLLAPDRVGAGRGDRVGQGLLDRQAGAVEHRLQRLLPALVAPRARWCLAWLARVRTRICRSQVAFPSRRTGRTRGVLQEGLLDQVGGIEPNPQRLADQRAGHQPEVVAIEFQEPPRGLVAGAGLLQEPLRDRIGRSHAGLLRPRSGVFQELLSDLEHQQNQRLKSHG